ncbi:MAG TPA: chemotaxis response regulator protein-glutamate methylesterase [Parvibaculum sp.]
MKIGIVNDLPMAVEALRHVVALVPEHRVAWVARTGFEAVALCAADTPDLVLMDIVMPDMDGVEATRRIMESSPCAVLIVTACVEADTPRIFDAMGYGALDAVNTPTLDPADPHAGAAPLLAKIDMVNRLKGNGIRGRENARTLSAGAMPPLVAIGASAGGPAALGAVLGALPPDFPASIIIVQHVDERFAAGMAEWLSRHSVFPVRLAAEGDRPAPRQVLLAGSGDHLSFKTADRLGYTPEPRDSIYRPSIDVFFRSVAKLWRGEAAGVLLTGMGSDGAAGLKDLRDRGCYTIAQDEASSAVYGMPKAAAAAKAAVDILPLNGIAASLAKIFSPAKAG